MARTGSGTGAAWAWGANGIGQSGTGDALGVHPFPVPVPALPDVTAIAATGSHALALKGDGTVVAWGDDASLPGSAIAPLISATPVYSSAVPVPVPGLTSIVAIAAGQDFGLAVRRDGTVLAFGHNRAGQLGDGTTTDRRVPVRVAGLIGVVAVAAGNGHSLALTRGGAIYAWGRNNTGQLGDGTTQDRRTPTRVRGLTEVVAIDAAGGHSVAVRRDGTVYRWGRDGDIRINAGNPGLILPSQPLPRRVPGLSDIAAVAAGETDPFDEFPFDLALRWDGTVLAWGNNQFAQLGRPAGPDKLSPAPVRGLPPIVAIATGFVTGFGLARDGTVWGWGANPFDARGLQPDEPIPSGRPRPVPILSGAVAIAAGASNGLAIARTSGTAGQMAATTTARVTAYRAAVTVTTVAVANGTAVADAYATARATGPTGVSTPVATPRPTIRLGALPASRHPLPVRSLRPSVRCGRSDLDVGPRQVRVLAGTHEYAHVCVHDGSVLLAGPDLTVEAQTVYVDGSSDVRAAGVVGAVAVVPTPGCRRARSAQHPGAPGAGAPPGRNDAVGYGGAGGGTVTLVARTIVVGGLVSADGAPGQQGSANLCDEGCLGRTANGGGGGGGGSVRLVAHEVQLTGLLSAVGGQGAPPTAPYPNQYGQLPLGSAGAAGSPGCTTILADTLRSPSGPPPVAGPLLVGRRVPSDPAPPVAPGSSYFPADGHTLAGPFLRYWQRHGDLAMLGAPASEPFGAGGQLEQYTERALLVLAGGRIHPAPLGRLLTAGRHFGRVPAVASTATQLYVPATGQVLAGRYLAYWRTHHGATDLGAPISGVLREANGDGSGRRYALQWFEDGRVEYHPELAGTRYEMEQGLVGVEALRRRGWLP